MQQEVLEACGKLGVCFIILDLLQAQANLQECLAVLLSDDIIDSDGEVYVAIVSTDSGEGIVHPVLPDLDTALDYVRKEIAKYAARGGQS